jgi:hypothetical protein
MATRQEVLTLLMARAPHRVALDPDQRVLLHDLLQQVVEGNRPPA